MNPLGDLPSELRRYVRDGRISVIPAKRAARLLLLDQVAQAFEPGHRYSELAVNEILKSLYDDHAALRRYLVDEELLSRTAGGTYWRSGGTVPITPLPCQPVSPSPRYRVSPLPRYPVTVSARYPVTPLPRYPVTPRQSTRPSAWITARNADAGSCCQSKWIVVYIPMYKTIHCLRRANVLKDNSKKFLVRNTSTGDVGSGYLGWRRRTSLNSCQR